MGVSVVAGGIFDSVSVVAVADSKFDSDAGVDVVAVANFGWFAGVAGVDGDTDSLAGIFDDELGRTGNDRQAL